MNSLRHIRKNIFRLNQAEFADLIGTTQATVSRWENGGGPSLDDLKAIRGAAAARGIEWNDDWFFVAPPQPERTAAVDGLDTISQGADRVLLAGPAADLHEDTPLGAGPAFSDCTPLHQEAAE